MTRGVFIHSLPRVGSTWFAYKFDQPGIHFRFEPLHENLISGTHGALQAGFEKLKFGRSLRHPERSQHYHKDYKFKSEGGVDLFEKRFCFDRYYMSMCDIDKKLERYLSSLFHTSEGDRQAYCAKSTKTALRAPWIAARFPGVHIYLTRHPQLIDNSFFSYRGFSNPYIRDNLLIIGKNSSHPIFAQLYDWSGLTAFNSDSLAEEQAFYRRLITNGYDSQFDRQFHYDCLLFFWSLGLAQATHYADLIVDIDSLKSKAARLKLENEISRLLGLEIDLSDCYFDEQRLRRVLKRRDRFASSSVLKIIRQAVRLANPNPEALRGLHVDSTSKEVGDLISSVFF